MLSKLFSDRVLIEHMTSEQLNGRLYPEEQKCLQAPTEKRLYEFTLGRLCARKVLARLGISDCPILVGRNREPLWPQGVVGSISHCGNDCVVAVSSDEHIVSVGVDVERAAPLDEDVADMVCTANEKRNLSAELPCAPAFGHALVFSAKESVYKCLSPITKTFLEFGDVEITLAGDEKKFSVEILLPEIRELIKPYRARGRYYSANGLIYTALELEKTATTEGE